MFLPQGTGFNLLLHLDGKAEKLNDNNASQASNKRQTVQELNLVEKEIRID